jgi:AAA domain, putative AbiEii toxin, Type IV TA system
VITELRLENWKSYKQASLFIDALSVLIGTNASGKSNALDALLLLNRVATGSSLTGALNGEGATAPVRGGVVWAARRTESRLGVTEKHEESDFPASPRESIFGLSVICRANEETDYKYSFQARVSDNRCELHSEALTRISYRLKKNVRTSPRELGLFWTEAVVAGAPLITARLYNANKSAPRQMTLTHPVVFQLFGQKLREEIQLGVDEVVTTLREIFILDPIPSHMRDYSPLSDKLDSDARNIAGVLAVATPEQQAAFEAAVSKYASHLPERDIKRVFAEKVGKFSTDAMLYCEEQWREERQVHAAPQAPGKGDDRRLTSITTIDARGMSDGTLRFIAILTALQTRPKGSLLVIEEVDNGLHPSRARLLLEMLREIARERGVDVLVTTHNPAMLDAMGPEMVPFITIANRDPIDGHSVLTLLEDVRQLPKLLAQGHIGKLSTRGLIEESLSRQQSADEAIEAAHG